MVQIKAKDLKWCQAGLEFYEVVDRVQFLYALGNHAYYKTLEVPKSMNQVSVGTIDKTLLGTPIWVDP